MTPDSPSLNPNPKEQPDARDPDRERRPGRPRRLGGRGCTELFVSTRQPVAVLPRRQLDVLREIANGASNAEAAARLFVGGRTVEVYLARAAATLGTSGRAQTVAVALRLGLLPLGGVRVPEALRARLTPVGGVEAPEPRRDASEALSAAPVAATGVEG